MKRLLMASLGLVVLVGVSVPLSAQGHARGKAELTLQGKTVSIDYGRPALHGRQVNDMLAKLQPGQVWRLGANESTTFSTDADLSFGSVTVPAGVYSLWARKESDKKWTLVFNKQHGQWGTEHDASLDLYSAPLHEDRVMTSDDLVTIDLKKHGDGGQFSVQWGNLKLANNFTVK